MPKQKSGSLVHVPDGTGGMRQIADLRFEEGDWPIILNIPARDAENWMAHVSAETEERGWSSNSFAQLDSAENSGSLFVHTSIGQTPATLEIVWEKTRGKELHVRARPNGDPILSLTSAHEFINAITTRVREKKTLRAHRQALLIYDGLPWRGELWLDENHRLGPPSKHADWLLAPQAIIVDVMCEGIGQQGVMANFQQRLHEIRVFLSMVLGIDTSINKIEFGWVPEINSQGNFSDCRLQNIGYIETVQTHGFPVVGSARPVERRVAERPGLGPYGITSDVHEKWVPTDIEQLWDSFMRLSSSKREHLLRAGNAHLSAAKMWPDQRTAYAAFLVVACEALKPEGKKFDELNVYDIVASLVSRDEAQRLRDLTYHPQKIRSGHLHRGELAAGELLPMFLHNHFRDPAFDEMLRTLSTVTQICLIEWLRFKGEYQIIRIPRAVQKTASHSKPAPAHGRVKK